MAAFTSRLRFVFSSSTPKPTPPSAPLVSNVKLTTLSSLREAETTIAINPTDAQNIVAGAICSPNNCFYRSLDGGQTWLQGVLTTPAGYAGSADPVVTFCPDGSAYYATLATLHNGASSKSGVFVLRSTDGGTTWPTQVPVVERVSAEESITDKPWMTCDTSGSAFSGRLYVEYTDPQLVPSGTCTANGCRVVKVRRSINQGASWSSEVMVSANPQRPQNQGSLAVGPNGELYVAWDWVGIPGQNFGSIRVDRSTDGGVTFGTDVVATSFTGIPFGGFTGFSRRLTYPIIGADTSNGPYRGNVYIAFADGRNPDFDILLIRSTDGGANWSAPIRVNDDALGNLAEQWAPGLATRPSTPTS